MTDYANLAVMVRGILQDPNSLNITDANIEIGVKLALSEYARYCPAPAEKNIDVGSETNVFDMSDIADLQRIDKVWWPWSSSSGSAAMGAQDVNRVSGYTLMWSSGSASLWLYATDSGMPESGDEVHVWYGAGYSIGGLDGATTTTAGLDLNVLALGTAGYCAAWMAGSRGDMIKSGDEASLSRSLLAQYRKQLTDLSLHGRVNTGASSKGWSLDKWDKSR